MPNFTTRPTLATGQSTGGAILTAQIDALLAGGFRGISNTTVLAAYGDYHLIEYWGRTDWDTYGHITGSYQAAPGDLSLATLPVLDPAGTNVIYCWSGQTASMVAAWLTILGYDAKDLSFSANGMIYSDLASHNWTSSTPEDFDYDTGP